jgi:hypothetical protein
MLSKEQAHDQCVVTLPPDAVPSVLPPFTVQEIRKRVRVVVSESCLRLRDRQLLDR